MKDPIVIASSARTPIGKLQGRLSSTSAVDLAATAIGAAVERCGQINLNISEAILGNVLPAGQGQAPTRQAIIKAGLDKSIGCTTINKMCGSGMKATMLAHDMLLVGGHDAIIAGGMESMSNAPHLIPKMRSGVKMGDVKIYDHMFQDGLEDAYQKGKLMGYFAEMCVRKYKFSREAQDEYAITSLQRAIDATKQGRFNQEIVPTITSARQQTQIASDELPDNINVEKITNLKPVFDPAGSITPANASSISDGAAAMILMRLSTAERLNVQPQAVILGHSSYAAAPEWFTTAPIYAMKKLMAQLNASIGEFDLFEINEAFAVVTLAAMKELGLTHDSVNINGGACALGHPVGASGARILITLMHALKQNNVKRGIASLCIGGGEATAMAVELLS